LALRGRPPSTTSEQVGRVALELFATRGFEQTTVDDIAQALGVGRRTVFRYFPSKNDIVWGDFDWVLDRLRTDLAAIPRDVPVMEAIARAAVSSNRYGPEQLPDLRIRMTLITTVPALQAHSMLRYADWRGVIAEYVADRTGEPVDSLTAQTISHAALGVSMAAFTTWVQDPEQDLEQAITTAYAQLASGWSGLRSGS
jgi:mycofactocin system transcriptional regulator